MLDNLNISLDGVSTEFPRLKPGAVKCQISDAELKLNKRGDGYNLFVAFETAEPAESTAGDSINPGYKLQSYMPTSSENPDFDPLPKIARLFEAALGKATAINAEEVAKLLGKEIVVNVKLTESDEYGLQNEVKSVRAV